MWSLYSPIRMPYTSKSCGKMRDFTKKYFHLNSSAVYNSSAKNEMHTGWQKCLGIIEVNPHITSISKVKTDEIQTKKWTLIHESEICKHIKTIKHI